MGSLVSAGGFGQKNAKGVLKMLVRKSEGGAKGGGLQTLAQRFNLEVRLKSNDTSPDVKEKSAHHWRAPEVKSHQKRTKVLGQMKIKARLKKTPKNYVADVYIR